jgi:hypothetical protein
MGSDNYPNVKAVMPREYSEILPVGDASKSSRSLIQRMENLPIRVIHLEMLTMHDKARTW